MNRASFQRLANIRLRDSEVLLRNRRFAAAYYLAGYAVECALKACMAKKTRRHDFPDRGAAQFYTHNLPRLLEHSGLDVDEDPALQQSWTAVKDWSEEVRYREVSEAEARDIYAAACFVLAWIKGRW